MTTQTEEWENRFDERFVREDGLMDKYDTDEDGDPAFTSESIKDFIRTLLTQERTRLKEEIQQIVIEDVPWQYQERLLTALSKINK